MGAIFGIDGTHGIPDARAAPNSLRSQPFWLKINEVHDIKASPEPGPELRAALGQSWSRLSHTVWLNFMEVE